MNKEGIEYRGILYGQFMATSNGVKLIEYNVRFGDPEAMNVLPILESDFGELCMDVLQGTLKGAKFMKVATVCKYLVPAGYPENPMTGTKIDVPVEDSELLKVFFASVYEEDGSIYTTSSRALALVGLGESIYEAEERVEKAISLIKGNLFYRKDIGKKHLVERRVKHMKELRSGI
jgi:phosphoribosylamine--glycine ligase